MALDPLSSVDGSASDNAAETPSGAGALSPVEDQARCGDHAISRVHDAVVLECWRALGARNEYPEANLVSSESTPTLLRDA